MAENKKFGYARVSSKDQNESRQIEQFKALGIEERDIFLDKKSGKNFEREAYKSMMYQLREGDIVYVTSLDRLGRNYKETLEQWREITEVKKADIIVLDMPILDTTNNKDLIGNLITDIVLNLLSYVAESERERIHTRQKEGIALAKERGAYKGRVPIKVNPLEFVDLYRTVISGEHTAGWVMKKMGLKRNTFYRLLDDMYERRGQFVGVEYEMPARRVRGIPKDE